MRNALFVDRSLARVGAVGVSVNLRLMGTIKCSAIPVAYLVEFIDFVVSPRVTMQSRLSLFVVPGHDLSPSQSRLPHLKFGYNVRSPTTAGYAQRGHFSVECVKHAWRRWLSAHCFEPMSWFSMSHHGVISNAPLVSRHEDDLRGSRRSREKRETGASTNELLVL